MEWLRKDGNLEERVIIYSKFKKVDYIPEYSELENGDIFAAYVTVDVDNIKNLSCFSEERLEQDAAFDEEYSGLTISEGTRVLPFDVESEKELLEKPEWILYVGEYTNPDRCEEAIDLGLDYYLLQLEEFDEEEPIVEEETKDYETIPAGKLRWHILREYAKPMMDAANSEETLELIKVKERFIEFSVDTPFYSETLEICKTITRKGKSQDTLLVSSYLAKVVRIIAAEREEYVLAAEMRDNIRELE
tara:strand:+ start:1468 stop:2208 length:741 start_codon:yes stop_codon:yes gene_type:complete